MEKQTGIGEDGCDLSRKEMQGKRGEAGCILRRMVLPFTETGNLGKVYTQGVGQELGREHDN